MTTIDLLANRSLREVEAVARERLDPAVYDFFAGGADDEVTLRANASAFARLPLVPRVLRGAAPDLATSLLGTRLSMPVLVSPTAFHRLAHPDGELATARATAAAGTLLVVSMAATVAVEEVAAAARAAGGPAPWFQLYLQPDRGFTAAVAARAEAAGCRALVVSVDSPAFGHRERDHRNGFHDLPDGLRCENLRDPETGAVRSIQFSPRLGWPDLDWLRTITRLPIILKGVVHPTDAQRAVGWGADGLLVSNHGGRQLDTVPASIALLPAVVAAAGDRIPVLLDGGVRRGTDVVKALALGASAVGIGRPVVWGLAAGGEAGVAGVLANLRDELARALALCGCATPAEATPDLVRTGGDTLCGLH